MRVTIDKKIAINYPYKSQWNMYLNFIQDPYYTYDNTFYNTNVLLPKYKGLANLNFAFIPDLRNIFEKKIKQFLINDMLILLEFTLTDKGQINSIYISTSKLIESGKLNQIKTIISDGFNNILIPPKDKDGDKSFNCNFFIPIYYNNDFVIGKYDLVKY